MTGLRLEVDLGVLAANIAAVRARVAPAEMMLVVKDDAYGHGLEAVVSRASAEGVRWFGAFDVHDALVTRGVVGEGARIFSWLTVGREEIAAALDAHVDLGVGDAGFLEDIASVARTVGAVARVHLKIDTGLHRNGIRPEQWPSILERSVALQAEGAIRVVGVWSHIAEASDETDDEARAVFDEAVSAAEAAGFAIEVRHLAASAASFARAEFRYDLVRVGAFCYGVRSAHGESETALGIRPIGSLIAPVTRVDQAHAVIGVGSLHGLPSSLARRASLRHATGALPIDRIDEAHSTVTAWAGSAAGEEIVVFGAGGRSATDLAEAIDTVGEEILVRVSPLVPRTYLGS
ncbi:MAG: alanine racemase [Microbacterium pygmaeum]